MIRRNYRHGPIRDDFGSAPQFGADVTIVPLVFDAVLSLARQHLMALYQTYLAPEIPHRKENNVRGVHAATLPEEEPLVALYDDTVFGAGDDGFAITPSRIVWRNYTEQPGALLFAEITSVEGADKLLLINGTCKITVTLGDKGIAERADPLLRSLAASARAMGAPPPFAYGAPAAYPPPPAASPAACRYCGAPRGGPGAFCTSCGARD